MRIVVWDPENSMGSMIFHPIFVMKIMLNLDQLIKSKESSEYRNGNTNERKKPNNLSHIPLLNPVLASWSK